MAIEYVIAGAFKVAAATKARKRRRKIKRAQRAAFAIRQREIALRQSQLDIQLKELGVNRLKTLMAARESAAARGFADTPFETGITKEIEDKFSRAERQILLNKDLLRLGGDMIEVDRDVSRYSQPDYAEQLFSSFGPSDFSFLN